MAKLADRVSIPMAAQNQKQLVGEPIFRALFITQFTGAFNDNFYKSALLMLFTYGGVHHWGIDINIMNNLVSATLIIPFLLLASLAGQVADKYERSYLIQRIKIAEVMIMCGGALALWLGSPLALLLVLLFTGIQSACFSPLKYAIVPQLVKPQALVGGNGLMHAGTSMAIFLGLIVGSLAVQLPGGKWIVAIGALTLALWGWHNSRRIPVVDVADAELALRWNPWTQTWHTLGLARRDALVFWAIIGVSWYWFLGSMYLTQIPNLARSVLLADPLLVPILLVLFLVGLSLGALACERISRGRVEAGLVPLGALAILLVGTDLVFACRAMVNVNQQVVMQGAEQLHSLAALLTMPGIWRVMADVALLGVCGALYVVPLLALLQTRSNSRYRAQIMGANNVVNALFMVMAAVSASLMLGVLDISIPTMFSVVITMHALMSALMFWRAVEFRQRFWRHIIGRQA